MKFDTLYAPPTPPSLDDIIFYETKQKVKELRSTIRKKKQEEKNNNLQDEEVFLINGEEIIVVDPEKINQDEAEHL